MDALVTEYTNYEDFADDWDDSSENETRMLWQLLGQLADDEVMLRLPEWLAEANIGFVDGAIPTIFVGRLDRETEQAVRVVDSAAAGRLMKQAHRLHHFEEGIRNVGCSDEERRQWLEDRRRKTRREFEARDSVTSLREEWIPKSQLLNVARRSDRRP